MQSLSQEIKGFSKTNLKKQSTRVTALSGRRTIETWKGSTVEVVEDVSEPDRGCGYVHDYSSDLQVGVIRPYLLLGSQDVAQDLGTLRKFKVSHILNVAYGVENAFPYEFIYKYLEILDLPETAITSYFQECFEFIDQAKAADGVVLVHCNAGVSRSASIVVGYLMSREGLAFDEAFDSVKKERPAVCPNPGFLVQLKNFRPQEDVH
ncbi:hypothetical protein MATL_G00146590 [Megalops atlanticus]|uniref:Dual specificity protein phosphatase 19 n=1 Tax=Megalops atlanticus TaxID=7932 RepID=A0A9D3T9L2_MEGAT|nr:hypothetical protein MATL_G00146590 [Megalops atlanticus]